MITEQTFKTELKKLGLSNYKVVGNDIVILTSITSRPERERLLKTIQGSFVKESEYVKDKGAGFLRVKLPSKTIKIYIKPEKTGSGLILKPQFFAGLTDKFIPFLLYHNKVLDSIEAAYLAKKLSLPQKALLDALVEYHSDNTSSKLKTLKETFTVFKDAIPISTLNNDFSEVLGPLAVINFQLVDKKILGGTSSVFLPGRGNEPLLDYKILSSKGSSKTVYNISSKSGDTTNTLKPGDVISLLGDEPLLFKKYNGTVEYEVVKILKENTVKEGPIKAIKFLKTKNFKKAKFITEASVYTEELRQQCEKTLVSISKEDIDFTPMFNDATNAKIHYVKFQLSSDGTPKWDYIEQKKERPDIQRKRIVFRSKNAVGRAADKLGFQPQ